MTEQYEIQSVDMLLTFNGGARVIFDVDKQVATKIQNAVLSATERLKQGKKYGLSFVEVKRKRSLDANAYFHVLCSKIAEKTKTSMDEIKNILVLRYGTALYNVEIPNGADIHQFWSYSRYIGEHDGKSQYLLYKQTHTLDSAEMARLIEGAISEAQQLGIETATPQELAHIQNMWDRTHKKETT
ncbi:MAG: hypothetical protein J1G02_06280 [Clostridiales bacterium]|nr:hypothetical protein [Clostridiales bacterium]